MEPIAGYRLVKRLGVGGFGEVWQADGPGGFAVALKFVALEDRAGEVEQRALEIVKGIRHANLLATFGAWVTGPHLIMALELADLSLWDRLHQAQREGQPGIPRAELLEYLGEAAKGLDHLNEHKHVLGTKTRVGVQHRDVKPQNILLIGGSTKVADFGLARILERATTGHTGGMSLPYAAPEFFRGQTSDWSDQYSLAVTYAELRTGRRPFNGESLYGWMHQHLHVAPDLGRLPPGEQAVVARALAKAPEERWPNCRAFGEALRGASEALPVPEADRPPAPSADAMPMPETGPPQTLPASPRIANTLGIDLLPIPTGRFLMGSPGTEVGRFDDEQQHEVELTQSFCLASHLVTLGQFRRFVEASGYRTEAERDGRGGWGFNRRTRRLDGTKPRYTWREPGFEQTEQHPVVNVTWNDALQFCQWLSGKEQRHYSLPTEAQWEYVCRAGTRTRYWFGDDEAGLQEVGNVADETLAEALAAEEHRHRVFAPWRDGHAFTSPVGSFRANPWGLYDMHGNVWQWCRDAYEPHLLGVLKDPCPSSVAPDASRVVRGGSWYARPSHARAACRGRFPSSYRHNAVGFRIALRLTPGTP
jgi:formylglycine-generating enzyme required for sulfatase activity